MVRKMGSSGSWGVFMRAKFVAGPVTVPRARLCIRLASPMRSTNSQATASGYTFSLPHHFQLPARAQQHHPRRRGADASSSCRQFTTWSAPRTMTASTSAYTAGVGLSRLIGRRGYQARGPVAAPLCGKTRPSPRASPPCRRGPPIPWATARPAGRI